MYRYQWKVVEVESEFQRVCVREDKKKHELRQPVKHCEHVELYVLIVAEESGIRQAAKFDKPVICFSELMRRIYVFTPPRRRLLLLPPRRWKQWVLVCVSLPVYLHRDSRFPNTFQLKQCF